MKPPMAMPNQTRSEYLVADRISADPAICGGRPCIAGTRMRVMDILGMIAAGDTVDEVLREFDYLTREDISAALLYAATFVDHRVIAAA